MKTSKGLLQNNYTSFAEFESYSETYSLHTRLGYDTPEDAWQANPRIQWSTDPADFKKVEPKPTPVKFLIHPANGDLIAYFPYKKFAFNGYRHDLHTCYSHVGQHSACAPEYAKECRYATPEEYAALKKELENYGPPEAHYTLKVLNPPRKIFLVTDKSGRSEKPCRLDGASIKATWKEGRRDWETWQTLTNYLRTSQIGDKWDVQNAGMIRIE